MADQQRIAKLLARAGIASRREIERMIEDRRIAIDGVPLETPATIVTSLKGITVDGNPVAAPEPTRLFRYHKPTGLLTAERDMKGRATIYDKLPPGMPRTVPVGRLDLNTEGLLLMTTDGALKRRLELPSTGIPRSYRARAYGPVTQAQLEELIHGIEIDGVRYGQIDANLERRTGTNVWIEMTLKEGKNREVRRVLEHLGLRVSRLIRTSYGPFALEDLPAGEVEEVKQHELVEFLKDLDNAEPQPAPEPGIKGTALRKHWRITPSKVARPSFPSPPGERATRAPARRGEGRTAPSADRTPIPKYRPDPVDRPKPAAPARNPAPMRTPAATTAPEAPRPPRPKPKASWAKAKPKPNSRPRKS